jgi:hypothetical protein
MERMRIIRRAMLSVLLPVRKPAAGAGPASAAAHAGLIIEQSLNVQFIQKRILGILKDLDTHFSALSLPEVLPEVSPAMNRAALTGLHYRNEGRAESVST